MVLIGGSESTWAKCEKTLNTSTAEGWEKKQGRLELGTGRQNGPNGQGPQSNEPKHWVTGKTPKSPKLTVTQNTVTIAFPPVGISQEGG